MVPVDNVYADGIGLASSLNANSLSESTATRRWPTRLM